MFKQTCPHDPSGNHMRVQGTASCIRCGAVDEDLEAAAHASRERIIEVGAKQSYQNEIRSVSLQLLSMFMNQNMIRDMGQVIRGPEAVKAPQALTDMLDQSIAGAIHMVNEIAKLKPSERYGEQYAARVNAAPTIVPIPFGGSFPPDEVA